jgi:hypothetical protein
MGHDQEIARQRQAYREAHDRFVTRLRNAPADAAARPETGGGWSALQIGWHVAAVDAGFAAIVTGERPAAKPVEPAMVRSWTAIAAEIPSRLDAGKGVTPPAEVSRDEVLASLEASADKLEVALAGLQADRASAFAVTHPVVGTVALGQIGDWAVAHTIRHNAQAKRVLGQ